MSMREMLEKAWHRDSNRRTTETQEKDNRPAWRTVGTSASNTGSERVVSFSGEVDGNLLLRPLRPKFSAHWEHSTRLKPVCPQPRQSYPHCRGRHNARVLSQLLHAISLVLECLLIVSRIQRTLPPPTCNCKSSDRTADINEDHES